MGQAALWRWYVRSNLVFNVSSMVLITVLKMTTERGSPLYTHFLKENSGVDQYCVRT